MNPVFWFLVLLLLPTVAWFGSSILFKPVGKWLYRIGNKTEKILNEEENEQEENK